MLYTIESIIDSLEDTARVLEGSKSSDPSAIEDSYPYAVGYAKAGVRRVLDDLQRIQKDLQSWNCPQGGSCPPQMPYNSIVVNQSPSMNDFDLQEMHLESTLFPWLDSDCMSDLIEEQPFDFDDYINSDEDYWMNFTSFGAIVFALSFTFFALLLPFWWWLTNLKCWLLVNN